MITAIKGALRTEPSAGVVALEQAGLIRAGVWDDGAIEPPEWTAAEAAAAHAVSFSDRDEVFPATDPDGPSIVRSFRRETEELHVKDTEMRLICSSVRCGLTIDRALAFKCASCQRVYYCGSGCQREDWKARHKTLCAQIRLMAEYIGDAAVDVTSGSTGSSTQ